ncbi:hypothetical protein [Streptomyces albogriseolus]|uniref:hypothetical protein n=1 Tax=Streptomyces albogriseolus TaxID=1887 RepID=UPI00345F7295
MQPYVAGTRWAFQSRESGYRNTEELVLLPLPANGEITDDYTHDEISAQELWQLWAKDANRYHERYPDHFRPGEIPIVWTVTKPSWDGVYELAPHTRDPRNLMPEFKDDPQQDFLTWYTHPEHEKTGETVNWLRLPVADRAWNNTAGDKGGCPGGHGMEAVGTPANYERRGDRTGRRAVGARPDLKPAARTLAVHVVASVRGPRQLHDEASRPV